MSKKVLDNYKNKSYTPADDLEKKRERRKVIHEFNFKSKRDDNVIKAVKEALKKFR